VPIFSIVLATHIGLALALVMPTLVLPFALRAQRRAAPGAGPGRLVRGLLWLETHGTSVLGVGVAATGILLIVLIGPVIVGQPWLVAALGIYTVILVIAFFVQRPALATVFGSPARPEDPSWRERARRLRYMSYCLAAMVGVIAFLMTQKPALW
jgi:hypothetical protein